MAVFVGALVVALVLLIAVYVLVREHLSMALAPQPVKFEVHESVAWVAEHLDVDTASALTLDDVRQVIDWQIELFTRKGVAVNGSTPHHVAPVVVGHAETVAYVLQQASRHGMEITPAQAAAVIELQFAYLRAIGAVGSVADGSELRTDD